MKLTLKLDKTVEQNAAIYFEKAKKAKRKLEGALIALENRKKKLAELTEKQKMEKEKTREKETATKPAKKEWYEKFRWFISSEGFLVIGGRDATTNEIILKKHTEKDDLVFHTDMAGSPFFVIKCSGAPAKPTEISLQEAADATASFSRAWKFGLATLDVFYVKPEQLSKTPEHGEYIEKGAFIARGKRTYIRPQMEIALGIKEGKIISGPLNAVNKQTKEYIVIIQGKDKPSDIAKIFRKRFSGNLDDIIRMLPVGGCKIKKS